MLPHLSNHSIQPTFVGKISPRGPIFFMWIYWWGSRLPHYPPIGWSWSNSPPRNWKHATFFLQDLSDVVPTGTTVATLCSDWCTSSTKNPDIGTKGSLGPPSSIKSIPCILFYPLELSVYKTLLSAPFFRTYCISSELYIALQNAPPIPKGT